MRIHELDDATVRKIAAGEVVERPASAVKELVENALDANAERVDVAVDRGGKDRIRIADDGIGMSREEVELAVREHTTSKIDDANDLDRIGTLGFRGEALYAIAAVSTTTITTRPRGTDAGTRLRVENGEVVSIEPAGRPPGTTVEVTELFAETPARRKFLRADATEFDHINRIVSRYALANPDVAVSLSHGDRETFSTTGQGGIEGAVLAVYGREVAESMIPVDAEGVSGFVSHPETTRAGREYMAIFVNGRAVESAALREAVLDAYGKQLAPNRYPFTILFVELPPGDVDVNVHPRKTEVRFDDEPAVTDWLRQSVEAALLDHGLVRSSAPRGRSAPTETEITPTGGVQEDAEPSPQPEGGRTTRNVPSPGVSNSGGGWRGGPARNRTDVRRRFRGEATQTTLDEGPADPEFERLPAMRVLGQLHDTYIVAETDDGLVVIDQHAADERVNYERLKGAVADNPASQTLAEPVEIELTAREAALLEAYAGALESIGFRAEPTGERIVEIQAVPAVLSHALDPALLRDVLSGAVDGPSASVDAQADALLADLACYPSITGNTSLKEGSVRELLEALDACENPYACPHGRPVLIAVGEDELAERFERDYPGHAGRRAE